MRVKQGEKGTGVHEEAGRRQEGAGMERGQGMMERGKRMTLRVEGLWEMTEEEDKTTMRTKNSS